MPLLPALLLSTLLLSTLLLSALSLRSRLSLLPSLALGGLLPSILAPLLAHPLVERRDAANELTCAVQRLRLRRVVARLAIARSARHLLQTLLEIREIVPDCPLECARVFRPGEAKRALRRTDLLLQLAIAHRLRRIRETSRGLTILAARVE